jgi:hypothetical protein
MKDMQCKMENGIKPESEAAGDEPGSPAPVARRPRSAPSEAKKGWNCWGFWSAKTIKTTLGDG